MPEGPEIFKASVLINNACKGRVFTGKVLKSEVNWKNPEIPFSASSYTITGESRGKELMLTLNKIDDEEKPARSNRRNDSKIPNKGKYSKRKTSKEASEELSVKTENNEMTYENGSHMDGKSSKSKSEDYLKEESLNILFRFGMSGKFMFTTPEQLHKHAHLMFYTKDSPPMVLSFVDVRRFGRWEITDAWSPNRSPDPIKDYKEFRENVLKSLNDSVFNKPICEVLNNQKYFNGIGNYLRAEILHRAGIAPFEQARRVLEPLRIKQEDTKKPDLLELSHLVPSEVIKLPGAGYDPEGNHSDYSTFNNWLQCYYNPDMQNLVDGDGRTIWFKGSAGPLAPKVKKSRGIVKSRKRKQGKKSEAEEEEENKTEQVDNKKRKRNPSLSKATSKRENKRDYQPRKGDGNSSRQQKVPKAKIQEVEMKGKRTKVAVHSKSKAEGGKRVSKRLKQPPTSKSKPKGAVRKKLCNVNERTAKNRKRGAK